MFDELFAAPPSGRSQEEIYNKIVERIKQQNDGNIVVITQ